MSKENGGAHSVGLAYDRKAASERKSKPDAYGSRHCLVAVRIKSHLDSTGADERVPLQLAQSEVSGHFGKDKKKEISASREQNLITDKKRVQGGDRE
jgi:hypothetical protein